MALAASLAVALSLAALGAAMLTDGCAARKDKSEKTRTPETVASASSQQTDAPQRKRAATIDDALQGARSSLKSLEKIKDYTCTFVKRERVGGELLEQERLKMKVRHQPFSVYFRFVEPPSLAGQEAIYVEGQNDGKLIGHPNGIKNQIIGAVSLDPTGYLAMRNNRYPITNAGMKNLVSLLVELGDQPDLLKDCRVEFIDGQRVDGRPCRCIEIRNPRRQENLTLAQASIWVDKEWNVPVRFEAWEWPKKAGKKPLLVEQYEYLDLKFDQGLTARDFDPENPSYDYP
ncbi:MAG TPA: DUF1571 domain-containing protein [Pirellulales bacterium]|nr:DUF1571 domain-containing protein [Pirellulales bacterium]